ncbi:asparagine synthase (glutamine-hydrolyzing) [Desulfatirhabdium butyrativorans]|uniref:asparagine synthase (glutamine-hydrolyzing) n=1 Tax=Desulfatirhabdium butyrativorans TaxID=340467 RepID=UPI000421DC8A|nr:asparagine synthase (glutamine-hydrolyzing) [Desulfatirhabdium butyrativorans]
MCGICGFSWNDAELIRRMSRRLIHRGPDQDGHFCCDGASLGHRRLSIIDLSQNGRQPMFNEDRSLVLVFNGEIYNFRELREELLQKGHVFASHSDSEVILHAWETYGTGALERLRGMFAFALYEAASGRIYLVRDRIGIKPLYYAVQNGRLRFASEIKAILEDERIERSLNPQALYDYLGFEFVPAPDTFFKGISKIPAGHYFVWEKGQGNLVRYWDLRMKPGSHRLSFDEAVATERRLLEEAVASHLISDVPLGVFLSGGLDSSALVAMMRRRITGSLKTFTIGYRDPSFSETEYARIVADHFQTDHQVLMIDDLKPEYVEQALWHLDEPMTDLSAVPLYLLCQQAKRHVTVCLSGEGGDESFAGYDRFKASRLYRWYCYVPREIRDGVIAKIVDRLPDRPQKKGLINMLKRFVEGARLPDEAMHLRWQYFLPPEMVDPLFKPDFRENLVLDPFRQIRQYAERCDAEDPVNREVYLDMRFMMTDSVLMKVDKMSMASALEIRVPLLDHVFVEFMASLPGDWKLKGLTTKHVFREALKGILPDKIVYRGKQGYSLPVKNLLRNELKSYMVDLLKSSAIIRETMNIDFIDRLIGEHLQMRHNHNHILWALMNVAIWHLHFF